jgi:hypothetical protein
MSASQTYLNLLRAGDRERSDDIRVTNAVLYQLSYTSSKEM